MAYLSLLPNLLTASRVGLTILALFSYYKISKLIFLVSLSLALLTDFFDGYLARKLGVTSKLGAILDPACDKILVALVLSFFYIEGVLSKTFYVLLLMRSFVQMFSFLYVMRWPVSFSIRPNFLAKALNGVFFFFIFVFSVILAFEAKSLLWSFEALPVFLWALSFFEIFFMVYYPWQFYRILKEEKHGFD